MNVFTASGHLGSDCQLSSTSGGTAVCSFSIAVSSGYGDNEKTTWVKCSVFGKRAEGKLPEHLLKGQEVVVSGEITLNEWEKDGVKHSMLKMAVDSLDLIGGGQSQGGQPAPEPVPQMAPQQAPQMAPAQNGYFFQDGQAMNPEQAQYYIGRGIPPWSKGTQPPA